VDTTNICAVAINGDKIIILRPLSVLTKEQALQLAAYLVAMADDNNEFPALLEAVRST
jgi:hypothetical protein